MVESFRLLEKLYADDGARRIWSEEATVDAWLRVEGELALAQAAEGVITIAEAEAIADVCRRGLADRSRLWADARNVGYPILGLVRAISAELPPGPDGRVHYGATTQDIMDTALALQAGSSTRYLAGLVTEIGDLLAGMVAEHAGTIMAARTHGQQAVPTTFGAKLAVYLHQLADARERLLRTGGAAARVSLFGAGGTNAAMGPQGAAVRRRLAEALGLDGADVPWHVGRDRLVDVAHACGVAAAVCVRLAREVVELSRSEVGEVAERAGHHRGASSTMPQKANPITAESIIGFGVAAEAECGGLLRTIEAQHERSAGEWQAEWLLLPQLVEHTASALALVRELVETMTVDRAAMSRNLDVDGGLLMSEAAMMQLAPELGRERAHDAVYAAAQRIRETGSSFGAALAAVLERSDDPGMTASVRPADYLGEARSVCRAAIDHWLDSRKEES
jgi:3-carboxy-cis,cis-muconate cycloisomerase